MSPDAFREGGSAASTRLKRFIRQLGRVRATELGIAACYEFVPVRGEVLWMERARKALLNLSTPPGLVAAYDSQSVEGFMHYPTRSCLHAVDLLARMAAESNFAGVYRQALRSLWVAACNPHDPTLSESDYFRALDQLHTTMFNRTSAANAANLQ